MDRDTYIADKEECENVVKAARDFYLKANKILNREIGD
jgi:hypothetical protein